MAAFLAPYTPPLREEHMPSFKSTTTSSFRSSTRNSEEEAVEAGVKMEVPSVMDRILTSDASETASVSTVRPSETIEELELEEEEDTPLSGSSIIAFWLIAAANR